MIRFNDLSVRRGSDVLFSQVTFRIGDRYKVGIVGHNGCGKSSLFALILGQHHADSGSCELRSNITLANVAQEAPSSDASALQYVIDGDSELSELRLKIEHAEKSNDGHRLAELLSEFEHQGGYSAESRAAKLLTGLGFANEVLQKSVSTFSGGWQMRLNLARTLMRRSDLLLLDEPTNHLDMEAVIWLEQWLRQYAGCLLLISHDKEFLDHVVDHVAHVEQKTIRLYKGNYSSFEEQRAARLAQQQAEFTKQERERKRIQSFVDKFRAKASGARQAQSRIKALQRLPLLSQAHVDSGFQFQFFAPEKNPRPLVQIERGSVGYNQVAILSNIELFIVPGDRIGLLGFNGAGKSTFIKLLVGEQGLLDGDLHRAPDTRIGYFAQHQLEQLDGGADALLHMQRLDENAREQSLRDYLGGFGFSNDKVSQAVATFSGGEKARLVLAMIVYRRPNLLLLDEPTNHLDIDMRIALSTALQEFEGAVVLVSHDRNLLRLVADEFLLVDSGKVTRFDGDLDDYAAWVQTQNSVNSALGANTNQRKMARQQSAEKRRQLSPLRKKLEKLEARMEQLTKARDENNALLADSSIYDDANKQKLTSLLTQQAGLEKELGAVELEWYDLSEELDQLMKPEE